MSHYVSARTLLAITLLTAGTLGAQFSHRSVNFRGEVRSAGPVDTLVVVATNLESTDSNQTYVAPNGTFEFNGLRPGDYEFRVQNVRGDVVAVSTARVDAGGAAVSIRVEEPERMQRPDGTISYKRLAHKIPKQAIKEFEKSLEATEKGDIDKSIAHLEKAIEIDPGYMEAHNNLGARYMAKQQPAKALTHFEAAMKLDPGSPMAASNAAVVLFTLQRFEEAETAARNAIALNGAELKARFVLGLSLLAREKSPDEAVRNLKMAAERFPRARLALAKMMVDRGSVEEAKTHLAIYLDDPKAENRQQVENWISTLRQREAGLLTAAR